MAHVHGRICPPLLVHVNPQRHVIFIDVRHVLLTPRSSTADSPSCSTASFQQGHSFQEALLKLERKLSASNQVVDMKFAELVDVSGPYLKLLTSVGVFAK